MRALGLILLLSGCGPEHERVPINPDTCEVWVAPPGGISLPILWRCTSGPGTADKPDHVVCIQCAGRPLWEPTEGGTCVPSCAICTPATVERWDPSSRCTPLGAPISSPDAGPGDLAE